MAALTNGVHRLHIRFKDNTHLWSSTLTHYFFKTSETESNATPKTVAYQYWFDDNFAQAITVNTPLQEIVNISDFLSAASLSNGLHQMHIRFKDNTHLWSSTLTHYFYKTSETESNATPKTVAYQYWLDDNYAQAITVNTPLQEVVNIDELLSMSTLSLGVHEFKIRFKDNTDLWSSTISQLFFKTQEQIVSPNVITHYRYWFNDDFASAVEISVPANEQVNLLNNLDLSQLPKGMHEIQFQFKDTTGFWSIVLFDSVQKLSLPIANFEFETISSCDSTNLTFTNTSMDGDVYTWDFGDGTTSTEVNPQHTYFAPGTYLISQTVTDTVALLDSTIVQAIQVVGNTFSTIDATECVSYIAPSGAIFNASGVYTDTIPNSLGCDSIITVNLTIIPLPNVGVTQNGTVLTATVSGATYQWLDCENNNVALVGETNQTFTAELDGSYAVVITKDGCQDTSACYVVSTIGILENSLTHQLVVFPNPTDGNVKVDFGETLSEIVVGIYDINGKLLAESSLKDAKEFETNLDYEAGVYLLKVHTGDKTVTLRVVKH